MNTDRRSFIARCSAAVAALVAGLSGRKSTADTMPRGSNFVSVKDELPPIGKPVLVIVVNHLGWQELGIGKYLGKKASDWDQNWKPVAFADSWEVQSRDYLPKQQKNPSHWAYYPAPPMDKWHHEYPRLTDAQKARKTKPKNFATVFEDDKLCADLLSRHPDASSFGLPEGGEYPRIEV